MIVIKDAVGFKIKLGGNAFLEKTIFDKSYYLRLFLEAEENGNKIYSPTQLDFKVRISELQYKYLEEVLKYSKENEIVLKFQGGLELVLNDSGF
ncbi:MAG: hypothetical protein AABW83_03575 [Nanoarchaeota archaeon]